MLGLEHLNHSPVAMFKRQIDPARVPTTTRHPLCEGQRAKQKAEVRDRSAGKTEAPLHQGCERDQVLKANARQGEPKAVTLTKGTDVGALPPGAAIP